MNTDKMANIAMNDNGFIFDPSTGYSYTTNETGMLVLKMLSAGLGKDEIIKNLCEEYDGSENLIESDFVHFTLMLEALDLLEL